MKKNKYNKALYGIGCILDKNPGTFPRPARKSRYIYATWCLRVGYRRLLRINALRNNIIHGLSSIFKHRYRFRDKRQIVVYKSPTAETETQARRLCAGAAIGT